MKTTWLYVFVGFALGLILPVLVGAIIVETRTGMSFGLIKFNLLSFIPFLQLGAIGNLGLFFLSNNRGWYNMQKGIIAATLLILAIVIGMNIFY